MAALPTLRELEYVVAVAEEGHFGRAAARCHVSQPALSMQIRRLEERLGVALFERAPRRVRPTPQGERLIAQARRVLEEARRFVALARDADVLAGPVRIGAIETLGPYYLPHVLLPLSERFSGLRPVLREGRTARLVQLLLDGELDVVLLAPPAGREGVELFPLFFEPFVLLCRRDDPLAARARPTLAELADGRMLLLEEGHCLREQALALCGTAAAGTIHATSVETLRQMVAAGLGHTLLPRLAVDERHPLAGVLHWAPLDDPDAGRDIALAWRVSDPRESHWRGLARFLCARRPPGTLPPRRRSGP